MTPKNTPSLTQRASTVLRNLLALIYLLLFIPALIFIPPLGAFVADAGLPFVGVLASILLLATIPLSMLISIYFIYTRSPDRQYGKMFFFCFLPLLCCILAPTAISLIVYIHDLFS